MLLRNVVFVGKEKWETIPKGKVVQSDCVKGVTMAIYGVPCHAGTDPTRRKLEKLQQRNPRSGGAEASFRLRNNWEPKNYGQ